MVLLSRLLVDCPHPKRDMNRLHSSDYPSVTVKRKRRRSKVKRSHKNPSEQWIKAEIILKFAFNGILSLAALVALTKLLPYQFSQQAKLKEVRVEVQDTEHRVNELRDHLNRNFDPQQSRKIMQEQSPMIDPAQRRVILVEKEKDSQVAAKVTAND
jgi:cell division protein FtsB